MKIAEALLLRKHLQDKVQQLHNIKLQGEQGLFEVKFKRESVNTNSQAALDEITAQVPKVTMKEITAEYDLYASELRKLDASIQQANWTFEVSYSQPQEIK